MERTNAVHIGEILAKIFNNPKLASDYKRAKVINSWEKILGKQVANATTKIYIKNKTLFVYFNSSIVRNEISMIKHTVIERLNEIAGDKIINEINLM